MRRCTRCILPDNYAAIRFASDGQCNICRHFRVYQYRGDEALQTIVSPFCNGSGQHDCIVSLSGGRDSSYVLAYVRQ